MGQTIEIVAALLVLGAFAAGQAGWLDAHSPTYLVLNMVGTAVLAVIVGGGDLDLESLHGRWQPHHQCADVPADVEQDRALPGIRVLGEVGRPLVGQVG